MHISFVKYIVKTQLRKQLCGKSGMNHWCIEVLITSQNQFIKIPLHTKLQHTASSQLVNTQQKQQEESAGIDRKRQTG